MTTLPSYEGMREIYDRLEAIRARRWAMKLATGVVALVAIVPATLLVVAVAAGYWPEQPPPLLRWALLGGSCLLWAFSLVWFVFRVFAWKQNPAQVARFIEEATPQVRNDLINSVLLSRDREQISPELVQQAIRESVRHARRVDMAKSISLKSLQRWGTAAAAAVLALTCFGIFQPRALSRGLMAVMKPTSYVSTQGSVEIEEVLPGDDTLHANETVTVIANVRNEAGTRLDARVVIDGQPQPRRMAASLAYTRFTTPLGKLTQTTRYAVYVGDTRWPPDRRWYVLTVLQRVEVKSLDLEYDYPPYLKWDSRKVEGADGSIHAPLGTMVMVTGRINTPVPRAVLYVRGATHTAGGDADNPATERASVMNRSADGRSFSGRIPIDGDGSYRIEFQSESGRSLGRWPSPGEADENGHTARTDLSSSFRIRALPDEPPKVAFVEPTSDVTVPAGGKLTVKVKVYDKYGLSRAALLYGLETKEDRAEAPGFCPPDLAGRQDHLIEYTLDLGTFRTNSILECRATVTDNRNLPRLRLGPQTTRSKPFRITIQDPTVVEEKRAQNFEELRKRLMAILDMQIAEKVNAQICLKADKLPKLKATAAKLFAGQKKIHKALVDVVAKFPFESSMETVKQALHELSGNEALLAVNQAQVVAALAEPGNRRQPCELLLRTQDKIIDTLQSLLAILPSLAKSPDQKKDKAAEDLPSDVADSVEELKNALEEFVEDQKKAIQASERLAKKPVDAFTGEDEKLLKELEVTEDKWEKFINEAITDFSKLLKQDFANPQLLKELVAVKTDVTMAKDALKKKATEIATAAEDNGVENAKTLTANLEKWLPDEPDRIKWSMEDLATSDQENLEQAELPTELEDLVGDLLEQEEDLFDEMDDVSSKSSMSGDKGIGWDAMDGPISNMNAQGVTGNQLPNTSEIHGRSGEGRTGKCTGEFVEDKAVGKGGRRTPTRLSPEPFQKGQVNDTSTEPPGGATGGGKLSGAGEEGLEGPIPPPLAQEMKRLAGKQAALLNKAERVRAGLKVSDMSHFKLLQAMSLMDRIYNDLRNFRYQNVLRARHGTLKALSDITDARTGEIDVSIDTSTNMPKYIRDNIADAMKGNLPEEYREALEKYYSRIGEIGSGP